MAVEVQIQIYFIINHNLAYYPHLHTTNSYFLIIGVIKYPLGGEFLTESLLDYVENNLKQEVIPRHYLDVKVEGETKTAERIECANMTDSFNTFSKIEIIRDLKENVCRFLDPKGDK